MKKILFLILFLFNISLQYIFQLKSSKRITNSDENEENENEQLVNELSESHVLEIQINVLI